MHSDLSNWGEAFFQGQSSLWGHFFSDSAKQERPYGKRRVFRRQSGAGRLIPKSMCAMKRRVDQSCLNEDSTPCLRAVPPSERDREPSCFPSDAAILCQLSTETLLHKVAQGCPSISSSGAVQ